MTYTEVALQVKRLPLQERLMLLETLTRSVREELRSATARPRSSAGKDLRHLAGTISPEDAGQMREAIEQGCEPMQLAAAYNTTRRPDPPSGCRAEYDNLWESTGCL